MSTSIASSSTTSGIHRRFGSLVQVRNRPGSLSFPAKSAVCKAISSSVPAVRSPKVPERGTEKLDYWMRESVAEIVKSLGTGETSAPLMVQVYSGGSSFNLRTERAVAEDWGRIRERWSSGVEASPDGIILVEELKDEEEIEAEEGSLVKLDEVKGQRRGDSSKVWGVVLMGRGEEGGVSSFLLKITSCGSSGGLCSNCVHYTLMKVKSFQESARSQLTNFWLVQPR